MVCIHFRDVEIYDSLTNILSYNTQLTPGPEKSIMTKSYVGVLGPNFNLFESTNGVSKVPLLIIVGGQPPFTQRKNRELSYFSHTLRGSNTL